MVRVWICGAALAAMSSAGVWAEAPTSPPPATVPVCDLITQAAQRYGIPVDYFTRLIWRESRFHLHALSPAGAQGIAQFMPATAADRGLADPYAASEALAQSAGYLDEMRKTFGNLGLAAAGYNAGPGRVSRWLLGQAVLPQETLDYVRAITGHDAEAWKAETKPRVVEDKDFSCARYAEIAGRAPDRSAAPADEAPHKPWAVILVGNPRRDLALAQFQTVKSQYSKFLGGVQPAVVRRRISGALVARYIVQVEQDTRAAAASFCSRLLRAGGACFVLASR